MNSQFDQHAKRTFRYSSRSSAGLSHPSTVSFDGTDRHSWCCTIRHGACAQLARGPSNSDKNSERHSAAGITTQGKVPSRSPCFILEHPRTHAHPGETETVAYQGHKVVPPSAAGLLEALLPQILSHAVRVIYMPRKISGIDADSKRPLAMALAKGASYVSRRRHLCSATDL